nr:MAG TPA: glycoside hydrolase family protein [Bacteriophage sp.]
MLGLISVPRPAASATSGGAGGSKLGWACRDVTVTETGWATQ